MHLPRLRPVPALLGAVLTLALTACGGTPGSADPVATEATSSSSPALTSTSAQPATSSSARASTPSSAPTTSTVDPAVAEGANTAACQGMQTELVRSNLYPLLVGQYKFNEYTTTSFLEPTQAYQAVATTDTTGAINQWVTKLNSSIATVATTQSPKNINSMLDNYKAAAASCGSRNQGTPVVFALTCGPAGLYISFQDVWTLTSSGSVACDGVRAVKKGGTEYTEQQRAAVATAYGPEGSLESLDTLYGMCADLDGYIVNPKPYAGSGLSDGQAKEAAGALVLCPDHPQAAAIQANIDAVAAAAASQQASVAAQSAQAQAVTEGRYITGGSYLIGSDIQPGTWRSVGERVTDCYWSLTSASGDILDNSFIEIAPQITITIPSSAAGFTASGCEFERIGD